VRGAGYVAEQAAATLEQISFTLSLNLTSITL